MRKSFKRTIVAVLAAALIMATLPLAKSMIRIRITTDLRNSLSRATTR